MQKVALGLSDGIDSAFSALVLKKLGYEVIGVHLIMSGDENLKCAEINAKEAGIPFEAVDIRDRLQKCVCEPFIDEYINGRTPSPCPGCNRDVKLPALYEAADRLGCDKIATGHYVLKKGTRLFMGNPSCDQSYMLARITPALNDRLLLPLGAYSKADVRKLALEAGLGAANRPDSRENCFIKGMNYTEYIELNRKGLLRGEGDLIYKGEIIGKHDGIYKYTVGQRWKDDIGDRRAYVTQIDAALNTITLALWEELFTTHTCVSNLNWIDGNIRKGKFDGAIRVRHTRWETPEAHFIINKDFAAVKTKSPLRAPAPGQTAAIYIGNELVGGGTVE